MAISNMDNRRNEAVDLINQNEHKAMVAGTGITGGTGTVYASDVANNGSYKRTEIYIDLTGLTSTVTDGDIIGVDGTSNPCHIGQITADVNGTVIGGYMQCLEVPAGGDPDIDLFSADEGTGVENGLITDLTETALLTSGGDWTVGAVKPLTAFPAADEYLYLVQGAPTGTAAAYTGGRYLIVLYATA